MPASPKRLSRSALIRSTFTASTPGFNFNPTAEERMRKPLSYEDTLAIGAECPSVLNAAAFMSPVDFFGGPFTQRVNVRYREIEMTNAAVQGASPAYFRMGVTTIAEGRYFTEEENSRHANVLVIGRDVANTLFPFTNALDKEATINGRAYRVVGVLAERDVFLVGAEDPNNENKAVYMPYLTLRKLYPDVDDNFVMAQARPGEMQQAVEEIRELLRRRRKVALWRGRQFWDFNFRTNHHAVWRNHGWRLCFDGGNLQCRLAGGWHRRDEYHARFGYGTNARGWRAQSDWRSPQRHRHPVPDRSGNADGPGRSVGNPCGSGIALLIQTIMPTYIPLWAPIVGFVVSVGLGCIWTLARVESGAPESDRSTRYE